MTKRLTYDEVKRYIEGEEGNGCILMSESYLNSQTKLNIKCACGELFEVNLNKFKTQNKRKCNRCSNQRVWTYQEVIEFVEVKSGSGCKLLSSKYKKSSSNLSFECKCGKSFVTTFNKFKDDGKRQCNECGYLVGSKKRVLSHRAYVNRVYEAVGCEYSVLEIYKNSRAPILHKHNKCGRVYRVKPNNFSSGYRCPKCYGKNKRTQEEFVEKVKKEHGDDYFILGEYNGQSKRLPVRHKCGYTYKVIPLNFMMGNFKCPKCFPWWSKTTEQFKKEVYEIFRSDYSVLSEYIKAEDRITMKHNVCGYVWETIPSRILRRKGCPRCNQSKGEVRVRLLLEKLGIEFRSEYLFEDLKGKKGNLRFDFALFREGSLSCLIEYDGEMHYHPLFGEEVLRAQNKNDQKKNDYCHRNGINLIRIPYWEFENIEKILRNRLIHNYKVPGEAIEKGVKYRPFAI